MNKEQIEAEVEKLIAPELTPEEEGRVLLDYSNQSVQVLSKINQEYIDLLEDMKKAKEILDRSEVETKEIISS